MLAQIRSWWRSLEERTVKQRIRSCLIIAAFSVLVFCGDIYLIMNIVMNDQAGMVAAYILLLSGLLCIMSLLGIVNIYWMEKINPILEKMITKSE